MFALFSQIKKRRKVSSIFTERICGSECLNYDQLCKCGNDEFKGSAGNTNYCCSNATCTKNINGDVTCSHGQVLPFAQSCNEECPIKNTGNFMAISSYGNIEGCPSHELFSKIIIKSDQANFGSFCEYNLNLQESEGISCSKPLNSKWSFDQCYISDIHSDLLR